MELPGFTRMTCLSQDIRVEHSSSIMNFQMDVKRYAIFSRKVSCTRKRVYTFMAWNVSFKNIVLFLILSTCVSYTNVNMVTISLNRKIILTPKSPIGDYPDKVIYQTTKKGVKFSECWSALLNIDWFSQLGFLVLPVETMLSRGMTSTIKQGESVDLNSN